MKVKAVIVIELEVPDQDSVSDIVHAVWAEGDPTDVHNACIYVDDVREVERFSWQAPV